MSDKPLTMDDAFAGWNAILEQMPVRQALKNLPPEVTSDDVSSDEPPSEYEQVLRKLWPDTEYNRMDGMHLETKSNDSYKIEILALWLCVRLGGKPAHHRMKAKRLSDCLFEWYGPSGVRKLVQGAVTVRLVFVRKEWILSPKRTLREKQARYIGYASGRVGEHARKGRYRPQILAIRGTLG